MNEHPLDIPNFLRVTPEEAARRKDMWKHHKFTKQGSGFRRVDAAEEKERKRLEREQAKIKAEKQAERFKQLRERTR